MNQVEIRHAHLFCGLGGGAAGFNRARPVVGNLQGKFRCIGGIDVDPAAIRDFERLAGVRGTVLDLFDRSQYIAFHGHEPPPDWSEATPADIHRAFGYERPHIVFLSAPCKGFSGLLSEGKSKTDKYQALNRLTERGVWLVLEAFKDDPVDLILFENVPRIATRGRPLLDRIEQLFQHYGYLSRETTHDCGELGGLAQSRKRFLLVARHPEKVPAYLYEPDSRPLRAVGDVLGKMPLPGAQVAGPMHRIPSLQWKTWVRLAFVEAGSDWRSLNKLAVEDGVLRDFGIVPEWAMQNGVLGVKRWGDTAGTVAARSLPTNGNFSIADPRPPAGAEQFGQYGVNRWGDAMGAVIGVKSPGQGGFSVQDPRYQDGPAGPHFANVYRVVRWDKPGPTVTTGASPSASGTSIADPRMNWSAGAHESKLHITAWTQPHKAVTGARGPYSGASAVADPRHAGPDKHSNEMAVTSWDAAARAVTSAHSTGQTVADPRDTHGFSKYAVTSYDAPAGTVIAGSTTGQGAFAVADPRALTRGKGDHYLTGGHYGVVPWSEPSYAVSAAACHDNGHWSVADPRPMPAPADKLVAIIRALDGTWHRPFTTMELAALQSLLDPEDAWVPWKFDGESDQAWRERIGNAVPPDAAQAIAEVMGETLLLAWSGETFLLSAQPVWVRPLAIALSVQGAP